MVDEAIMPDYSLSSHVAPLGMVFSTGTSLPAPYRGGAFDGLAGNGRLAGDVWRYRRGIVVLF